MVGQLMGVVLWCLLGTYLIAMPFCATLQPWQRGSAKARRGLFSLGFWCLRVDIWDLAREAQDQQTLVPNTIWFPRLLLVNFVVCLIPVLFVLVLGAHWVVLVLWIVASVSLPIIGLWALYWKVVFRPTYIFWSFAVMFVGVLAFLLKSRILDIAAMMPDWAQQVYLHEKGGTPFRSLGPLVIALAAIAWKRSLTEAGKIEKQITDRKNDITIPNTNGAKLDDRVNLVDWAAWTRYTCDTGAVYTILLAIFNLG